LGGGAGSYARNLLQFARDPQPQDIRRLLEQDAADPTFFATMALKVEQFRDVLLRALRPHATSRQQVLPAENPEPAGVFFPTPPGARWVDVHIRFLDGERVAVTVKDVSRTLNYTQMGMVDKRNSTPTKQWTLLLAFSRAYGV